MNARTLPNERPDEIETLLAGEGFLHGVPKKKQSGTGPLTHIWRKRREQLKARLTK